jgi:hypothetical protein
MHKGRSKKPSKKVQFGAEMVQKGLGVEFLTTDFPDSHG